MRKHSQSEGLSILFACILHGRPSMLARTILHSSTHCITLPTASLLTRIMFLTNSSPLTLAIASKATVLFGL